MSERFRFAYIQRVCTENRKKLKEAVSYPESSRREIEIEATERLEDFVNLYDYLLSKSNVNGLEDFDRHCIQKDRIQKDRIGF